MIIRFLFSLFLATLACTGCGLIYKQNIQQGNAIEQDDLELAESTLVSLLERDSEHPEAGNLLAQVRQMRRGRPSAELLAAKVDALQVWLEKLKLATERQASQ